MAPDITGNKIDIVLLDQFVRYLFAGFRGKPVIAIDNFDIQIASFATQMFDGKVNGVFHVVADHCGAGGQRGYKADFYTFGLSRYRQQAGGCGHCHEFSHFNSHQLFSDIVGKCPFSGVLWLQFSIILP